MKLSTILLPLLSAIVAADSDFDITSSATVYIQAIGSPSSPVAALAGIRYDSSSLSAEIDSYEAPELSDGSSLVRLGIYDPASKSWTSSTTVTSAETFAQGYSPTFILSLDVKGNVLGVTCKSGIVDAGQTRDFGPKVKVVKMAKGKQPELNRPIVLSPEGKVAEPEPEKTLFQRYILSHIQNSQLTDSTI